MSGESSLLESIFSAAIQKAITPEMLAHAEKVDGANPELGPQVKQLIEAHCATAKCFVDSPAEGIDRELPKHNPAIPTFTPEERRTMRPKHRAAGRIHCGSSSTAEPMNFARHQTDKIGHDHHNVA